MKGDDFTCEGEKERADSKTSGLGTVGDGSEGGKTSGSGAIGVSMLVSALACAIGMMAL